HRGPFLMYGNRATAGLVPFFPDVTRFWLAGQPISANCMPQSTLLGRVFHLDLTTCPLCQRGSLRIIAAIIQESVITRMLRPLKLASVPPPIAPARCRQEICTFD
ncbi:MAG: hypothetical protein V3U27_14710, partial [Candidatus Tectomicrobia bacterium]